MSDPDDHDPFSEADPIRRVADHFHMMLIAYAPDHAIDQLDGKTVVSSFSASGASDALTVDDVRAFLEAVERRA